MEWYSPWFCFSYLAWALCGTGLVVSVFETGEYQHGRGSVKDTALNALKGFMAVSLLQRPLNSLNLPSPPSSLTTESPLWNQLRKLAETSWQSWAAHRILAVLWAPVFLAGYQSSQAYLDAFIIIMMGYAVIKVFFANLKGGILLIQIAVGSLYMFSVPRGYIDGFTQWCKQIIGLCLTAFYRQPFLPQV